MPELRDLPNNEICTVIGYRLKTERLRLGLTQAFVAGSAGVSLRTYKRLEAAGQGAIDTFVAVLRVMNRLRALEVMLPAPSLPPRDTPVEKLERLRKRVRGLSAPELKQRERESTKSS